MRSVTLFTIPNDPKGNIITIVKVDVVVKTDVSEVQFSSICIHSVYESLT